MFRVVLCQKLTLIDEDKTGLDILMLFNLTLSILFAVKHLILLNTEADIISTLHINNIVLFLGYMSSYICSQILALNNL
jgi:hypothetical protein